MYQCCRFHFHFRSITFLLTLSLFPIILREISGSRRFIKSWVHCTDLSIRHTRKHAQAYGHSYVKIARAIHSRICNTIDASVLYHVIRSHAGCTYSSQMHVLCYLRVSMAMVRVLIIMMEQNNKIIRYLCLSMMKTIYYHECTLNCYLYSLKIMTIILLCNSHTLMQQEALT